MIIVTISDLKFALKVVCKERLEFSLLEDVIVSVVDSRLFVFGFDGCLNEGRGAAAFILTYFLLFFFNGGSRFLQHWLLRGLLLLRFLILILEVPCYKDILGLENLLLLFVSPHVNKYSSSNLQDSMHLSECCHSESRCWEVMNHCYGDYAIKDSISNWQLQWIAEESLEPTISFSADL